MRIHLAPAQSPHHNPLSHSSSSSSITTKPTPSAPSSSSKSSSGVEFSPPLIAMVVIIATAFVFITYSRLLSHHFLHLRRRYSHWRRRYVPSSSSAPPSNIQSPPYPFDPSDDIHVFSPYGLDDSAIKTIPISIYTSKSTVHDCAVCLLEFQENDYVRTLPVCLHSFHLDCVDIWLKSHANCPLCRAVIFRPVSPFTPVMASRIRPSLDDMMVQNTSLEPLTETLRECNSTTVGEITLEEPSPRRNTQFTDVRYNGRDFLLKRSHSFSFERNLASERLVLEPVTTSPWRYRRGGVGSFWSKRQSPFSSLTKPRLFSFRNYKGGTNMKSPFFPRRGGDGGGGGGGGSFYRLSESTERFGGSTSGGGGGSSRRSNKSFASPMFIRTSAAGFFSSSRQRSGDPEALLSPHRYHKSRG